MHPLKSNPSSSLFNLPPGSQPGQSVRDRLAVTWNSPDQYAMKGRLRNVDQRQIDFCAQTVTGKPLLYASKEFTDALENFRSNDPILDAALDAAAQTSTWLYPVANQNMVRFTFTKDWISYQVELNYAPERFEETSTGMDPTQGKITGIYISGPDVTNQERAAIRFPQAQQQSTSAPQAPPPVQGTTYNQSSRFLALNQTASTPNPNIAPGSSSVPARSAIFQPPYTGQTPVQPQAHGSGYYPPIGQSSSSAAGAVVGGPGANIPTLHPYVATMLASTAQDCDSLFNALFPKRQLPAGTPINEKIGLGKIRSNDWEAFGKFIGFLDARQPKMTLAECVADLKTFGEVRQAYVDFAGSVSAVMFMNRLREKCFPLRSWRYAQQSEHHNRTLVDLHTQAGYFDELLALRDTNIDSLFASQDKQRFDAIVADIKRIDPKNYNLHILMNNISIHFFTW